MSDFEPVPDEVRAIAKFWGGPDAIIINELNPGIWRFHAADPEDGFVYRVYRPGTRFGVYEDSGRPAGQGESGDWIVRCLNDAPDAIFSITADGMYWPYSGDHFKLDGWPT